MHEDNGQRNHSENGQNSPGAGGDAIVRGRARGHWARMGAVGLALAACAGVGASIAERAVRRNSVGRVFSVSDAPARRVVIVLGARVSADGAPYAVLEDRLRCALDLVRSGRAQYVLVSGDHGRREYDEVNAMRRFLVERGVPSERVYMDHAGFRTLDTMARAREQFAVSDAAICTTRFHLARSLWLASAFGIDAVGVISDRRVYPARRFDATREWFARVKAVLDTEVTGARPRFGGERIPIGERRSDSTHDRHTDANASGAVGGRGTDSSG